MACLYGCCFSQERKLPAIKSSMFRLLGMWINNNCSKSVCFSAFVPSPTEWFVWVLVCPQLLSWFNLPLLAGGIDCIAAALFQRIDKHVCIIHKPEQLHIWSFLPQSLSTFSFPLSLCLFLSVSINVTFIKLFDMQMTKSACLKTTRGRVRTQEHVVCFDFLNYDSDDQIMMLWFSFRDMWSLSY